MFSVDLGESGSSGILEVSPGSLLRAEGCSCIYKAWRKEICPGDLRNPSQA